MTVNSMRGPLNWSDQLSGLLATDAKAPAAGRAVGRIHASRDRALESPSELDVGIRTLSSTPSSVTDRSDVSPDSRLALPSVGAPEYVPEFRPRRSAAAVPDVSPRRQ